MDAGAESGAYVNEIDLIDLQPVQSAPSQLTDAPPIQEVKQDTPLIQEVSQEAPPRQEVRHNPSPDTSSTYEKLPDEFFKTIFYFSGMGSVIGSALEEGVYVDERYRGRAVDAEQLPPRLREQFHKEEFPLVIKCREQVHGISDGLKNLRNLLDMVPTYTDSNTPVTFRPSSTGPVPTEVIVDDPIHGHKFFLDNRRRDYRTE